jgi:O-antigen ligase
LGAADVLERPTFSLSRVVTFDRFHAFVFGAYLVSLVTTMSGMEIFSTLLWLCAAIEFTRTKPSFRPLPAFWKPVLAFVLVAIVGILLGPAKPAEKFYDFGRMRFFALYALLFYELTYVFQDSRRWLRTLFFACVIVGAYGFVQHFVPLDILHPEGKKIILYAIPETKIGPLVLGFFNHHLTFSNVFTFYACLFSAVGLYAWKREPWTLVLGLFLFLLLVWTDSRAAWIAIPFMLLCVAMGRGVKLAVLFLALSAIVMGTLYVTDAGFHERFSRTFLKQDDFYNLGPRKRLWKAQVEIFKEHPLVGLGYNNNERFAKEYVDRLFPDRTDNFYGHAHSVPLQLLASTGVLGFVCYLWIWFMVFARVLRQVYGFPPDRRERWVALGCLAAFVGFHIQGLTQWNFGDAKVLHTLMFFWAIVSAMPLPETKDSVVA